MNYRDCLLSLVLSTLLMSCAPPTAVSPGGITSEQPNLSPEQTNLMGANRGQQLPISAQATVASGYVIQLEVALTPRQQAMGLMYRPALPGNRGMLFPFDPPQPVSFWMKNVPVALDMVFIRDGVVQSVTTSAPPCTAEPCPTYGPDVPVSQVIELRAGRAAELGLKAGERIKIEFLRSSLNSSKSSF